jgi:hypothetical protein
MTVYTFSRTTPTTISPDVAARKAARKKVIEKARKLEHDSYKAMMRRRRRLQASTTIGAIM